MMVTCGAGGEQEYPLVAAAMEDAGLQPIIEYIRRWQATITDKFACSPIYELCAEAEWMPGTRLMVR